MIVNAVRDLEDAGAKFAAIAANTPHNAYDIIQKHSSATMEYGFFQKIFKDFGIETCVPDEADRSYIDKIIWEKLSHGTMEQEDRFKHKKIISKFIREGAQGIIGALVGHRLHSCSGGFGLRVSIKEKAGG